MPNKYTLEQTPEELTNDEDAVVTQTVTSVVKVGLPSLKSQIAQADKNIERLQARRASLALQYNEIVDELGLDVIMY